MPSDEVLLIKDLFISLMHTTYKCFAKEGAQEEANAIPESFLSFQQLPAFVGRFDEKATA